MSFTTEIPRQPDVVDAATLQQIYGSTIKILTTKDGFDKARLFAEEIAGQISKITGFIGIYGVGYPFYFRIPEGSSYTPPKEYTRHNKERLDIATSSLINGEWPCANCVQYTIPRQCCKSENRFTAYELFRSIVDVDLFVIIEDEAELEKIEEDILKIPEIRTWDTNPQESIQYYLGGGIFTDVHIIRISQLKESLKQVLGILELLKQTPNANIAELIQQEVVNASTLRGKKWSREHKLPLIFDLIFSAELLHSTSLHEDPEIIEIINKIAFIIKQSTDDELVQMIRRITQSYKPDSRVTRFTCEEDDKVIQQIIKSLKYRLASRGFAPQ